MSATGTPSATTLTLNAIASADLYANNPVVPGFGGTVEFLGSNGVSLGFAPVSGGTASLTVPRPAAGTSAYTALFISAIEDYRDAFRPFTVTVPKLTSTVKVKAPKKVTLHATTGKNGKPVVKAKKVKVKATVVTGGATATGTVTFKIGKKKVTRPLKNGVATLKIKISKRTKVVASYTGDANTAPSSGKAKIKVKIA